MKKSQFIKKLSEAKVSKALANKIVNALYKKDLDAKDFSSVYYRLKRKVENEELLAILEKQSTKVIEGIVDQIVAYRSSHSVGFNETCHQAFILNEIKKEKKKYKAGDLIKDMQILRTGNWTHPVYGKFNITEKNLINMKKHFDANVRGVELAVDEDHDPQHKALAWYRKINLKSGNTKAFADIELTQAGADHLNKGSYKYFSAEFATLYKDPESGKQYSDLLLGGAFTNRPFIKGMEPLQASEKSEAANKKQDNGADVPTFLFLSHSPIMKTFLELLHAVEDKEKITQSEADAITAAFNEMEEDDREASKELYNEAIKLAEGDSTPDSKDGDTPEETEDKPTETPDETPDTPEETEEGKDAPKETPDAPSDTPDEGGQGGDKVVHKSHGDVTKVSEAIVNEKDQTVTMSLSEYKESQKMLSQNVRKIRLSEATVKAKNIALNDSGTETMLTPASVKSLAEFAVELSEQQEEKMWSVVSGLTSVILGEFGVTTEDTAELDENGVKKFTENSQEVKFLLAEGLADTAEEAIEVAQQNWKDEKGIA